jgi:hypothetical protein
LTFGYFSLNAAITSANCFWPDEAVRIPSNVIEPLMLARAPVCVATVAVVAGFALFLDPPHAEAPEDHRDGEDSDGGCAHPAADLNACSMNIMP